MNIIIAGILDRACFSLDTLSFTLKNNSLQSLFTYRPTVISLGIEGSCLPVVYSLLFSPPPSRVAASRATCGEHVTLSHNQRFGEEVRVTDGAACDRKLEGGLDWAHYHPRSVRLGRRAARRAALRLGCWGSSPGARLFLGWLQHLFLSSALTATSACQGEGRAVR